MRAPTPIRLAGEGQSAGRTANGSPESATSDMSMIAPAYVVTDYVVGDLPALPDNTTGYVFDAGAMPSADDASRVAAALGVDGEPVQTDDGFSVFWRVGPDDGTAPSVTVFDDAMQSWNYDWGWVGRDAGVGCAVAGEPGIEPMPDVAPPPDIDPTDADAMSDGSAELVAPVESLPIEIDPNETVPVECTTPEPPAGIPTQADAEQRATDYLAAMGVDTSTVAFESYADEWSASVTGNEQVDGVNARSWGFGFGADAELQYAWGSVATPEPVGPYTLVDLDTAVARLTDGTYGFGATGRGVGVMEDLAASSDAAVTEGPVETMIAEPMPVDVPGGVPAEPEEITVTLVDVQPDLWWVWDADGSAWLLPAYRFIGDDGGWYTVPAVTDDFLIAEPTPVTTEPTVPVETTPPVDPPVDTNPGDSVPTADEIGPLVGMSLDEFTKATDPYPVRVVEIDGEPQAVTMDFSESRINVAVVGDGGAQYVVRATTDDGTLLGETEIPGVTIVPISSVTEGVAGYPACGTEPITYDEVTWYPVSNVESPTTDPELSKLLTTITSVTREPSPVGVPSGFAPKVAEPGPGDDVGTLVVWADGVARFGVRQRQPRCVAGRRRAHLPLGLLNGSRSDGTRPAGNLGGLMFDNLSNRLDGIVKRLRSKGRLTEADVDEIMKEIRSALLEADVNVTVVRSVCNRIREHAIGATRSQALDPGQQVVKAVNDELDPHPRWRDARRSSTPPSRRPSS